MEGCIIRYNHRLRNNKDTGKQKPARLLAALILSLMGAIIKIYGGAKYQSRAVLVDGITCIANLASGIAVYYAVRESIKPPDTDHPYGHERIAYAGILVLILAYMYSAGLATGVLLFSPRNYTVEAESAAYALLGSLFYLGSVLVSRTSGSAGASYGLFTFSEVLEGLVSGGTALIGAEISSLIDFTGAIVITGYIFVEVASEFKTLSSLLSDRVSPGLVEEIRRELEHMGFCVKYVRLRPGVPGRYVGDAHVVACRGLPIDVADLLVDEFVENLRGRGIDLTIHIDL